MEFNAKVGMPKRTDTNQPNDPTTVPRNPWPHVHALNKRLQHNSKAALICPKSWPRSRREWLIALLTTFTAAGGLPSKLANTAPELTCLEASPPGVTEEFVNLPCNFRSSSHFRRLPFHNCSPHCTRGSIWRTGIAA
jgi:hypothetical protein